MNIVLNKFGMTNSYPVLTPILYLSTVSIRYEGLANIFRWSGMLWKEWFVTSRVILKIKANAEHTLQGFVDSVWVSETSDIKLISEFIFSLRDNSITWINEKQATVVLSSTEDEYFSAAKRIEL